MVPSSSAAASSSVSSSSSDDDSDIFLLISIGLQTLVPGSVDVILLFESFSQVPHNHLVASPSVGPSSSLASPTRDGVGRKRTELSFTPVTIWAKGREGRTLILLGTRRWADFHFSLAHLTWSLPHSPNCSTP